VPREVVRRRAEKATLPTGSAFFRSIGKVFETGSTEPQQIERIEPRLCTAIEQQLANSMLIETNASSWVTGVSLARARSMTGK
jgi:hypothetical protein